jgi:CheY-like chemotaxis protein
MPSSVCILVVEDDPLVRDVICEMLKEIGFRVSEAGNGAEAHPILDSGSVDMLITDQMMIGEPGQRLADHAQSLGIPALLISGDANSIERLEAGEHPFLKKPFRLPEIQRMIGEILSKANGLKKAS